MASFFHGSEIAALKTVILLRIARVIAVNIGGLPGFRQCIGAMQICSSSRMHAPGTIASE